MEVHRIAGALGAEIHGVDMAQELGDNVVAAIRQALLDHLVIFFRDQKLSPERYMAFAQRFGQPIEYPFVKGIDGFPQIIEVKKLPHETLNFGGVWHSDTTYLDAPPMGSMLYALEVPPQGGDTIFANQYMAYDTLSDGLKQVLGPLRGVSDSMKADASRTREDRIASDGRPAAKARYVAEHPVVRTHPETGRKALYVNVAHTTHFVGMTQEESVPLLKYLYAHQVRPEFTCQFRWAPGSLAFWDNRAAQHNAINDYAGHRRVMQRITLAGDRPS
jgi:taurine dioxygenase